MVGNFDWDAVPDAEPKKAAGFDWDSAPDAEQDTESTSGLESGIRGAAQGASLGFADEITGGVEAGFDKLKGDERGLIDLYKTKRDESRKAYKKAEQDNPDEYLGGQLAGGAASLLVPVLNAGKGAQLAAMVGKGALSGGLAGLGGSEADLTEGDIGGAALDAGTGAALGAGLSLAGSRLVDGAKGFGRGLARGASSAPLPPGAGGEVFEAAGKALGKGVNAIPGAKTAASIVKTTGRVAGDGLDVLKGIVRPSQADDWAELKKFAESKGIDPSQLSESVEFGPRSFVSRASRNYREGPLGQEALKSFDKGRDVVESALVNEARNAGGGVALDRGSVGKMIQDEITTPNYLGKDGAFYSKLNKEVPGAALGEKARGRVDKALQSVYTKAQKAALGGDDVAQAQAKQVMDYVERIRKADGSYEVLNEVREGLGKALGRKPVMGQVPLDQTLLGELYGGLKGGLTREYGERLGPQELRALLEKNKAISSQMKLRAPFARAVGENAAPENVFESLISGGDSKKIESLKKILSPETMKRAKGAALNQILEKSRTGDNSISFKSAMNELRRKKDVLKQLLDPKEFEDFEKLIQLGERHGPDVLSMSGTGASNMFKDFVATIRDSALNRNVIESMKASARQRGASGVVPIEQAIKASAPAAAKPAASRLSIPAIGDPQNVDRLTNLLTRYKMLSDGGKSDKRRPAGNE